jgi:hypothetical protein
MAPRMYYPLLLCLVGYWDYFCIANARFVVVGTKGHLCFNTNTQTSIYVVKPFLVH